MNIDIGARVLDSGGRNVGTVERVIVDSMSWEATDVVVHADDPINDDFIVSLSLIARSEKGEVQLRFEADQLRQMPHFVEAEFEVPPPGGAEMLAYNPGNILVPVKPPFPSPYPVPPPPPPLQDLTSEVGASPIEIEEGTEVETVDGVIGHVDAVLLDTYDDRVTAIVVRASGLREEEVTIPIEWVFEVDESRVRVAATKDQVDELLGPPDGWYLPVEGRRRRGR